MILLINEADMSLVLPGSAVCTILSDRPGILMGGAPGYPDSDEGWLASMAPAKAIQPLEKGWLNVLLEGDIEPTRLWPSACGLVWMESAIWGNQLVSDGAAAIVACTMVEEATNVLQVMPYDKGVGNKSLLTTKEA